MNPLWEDYIKSTLLKGIVLSFHTSGVVSLNPHMIPEYGYLFIIDKLWKKKRWFRMQGFSNGFEGGGDRSYLIC